MRRKSCQPPGYGGYFPGGSFLTWGFLPVASTITPHRGGGTKILVGARAHWFWIYNWNLSNTIFPTPRPHNPPYQGIGNEETRNDRNKNAITAAPWAGPSPYRLRFYSGFNGSVCFFVVASPGLLTASGCLIFLGDGLCKGP